MYAYDVYMLEAKIACIHYLCICTHKHLQTDRQTDRQAGRQAGTGRNYFRAYYLLVQWDLSQQLPVCYQRHSL